MEGDDPNKILRLITIDAVNRLRIFLSFQAPPGFTMPLVQGKTLCVEPNLKLYVKDDEGRVEQVPLDLAVALLLAQMAFNLTEKMFVQGYIGGQDG